MFEVLSKVLKYLTAPSEAKTDSDSDIRAAPPAAKTDSDSDVERASSYSGINYPRREDFDLKAGRARLYTGNNNTDRDNFHLKAGRARLYTDNNNTHRDNFHLKAGRARLYTDNNNTDRDNFHAGRARRYSDNNNTHRENFHDGRGRRYSENNNTRRENSHHDLSPKVAKKRGKVPIIEYEVFREHRVEMVQQLVPEEIIPHLKENKVIDQDDVEKIENKCKDLRRKGAETMLDILYNSGRWAFTQLIVVLKYTGYQEMVEKLTGDLTKKETDPQPVNATKQRGRLSGLENEVLTENHERLVNELDSSILKNHLFQNGLIDEDDMERISKKEEELRKEGVEEMLNIIHNSGANIFPQLLKSLADAGYDELSLKLDSDLKQKKGTAMFGLKIDLNLLAFPNYPYSPQLTQETIQSGRDGLTNWYHEIKKWKDNDAGKSWCITMNNWFKDHEFENVEEFKLVIKDWLLKLEEVVNRGCLEVDKKKVILLVTIISSKLDGDKFSFQPSDNIIFQDVIQDLVPDSLPKGERKEFVKTKEESQRLLTQQRQVLKKLKDNLEGIIEGKQKSELRPLDTESCELAGYFHSVVDDVGERWNKLR